MKSIIVMVLMGSCATTPAFADPVVHLGSYHTDRVLIDGVCEINPGVGYRFGNHVEVGAYKNSFCNLSTYITVDYSFDGPSVFVGLASGYEGHVPGDVLVAGGSYHFDSGLTVRVGPSYNQETEKLGAVFGFSFAFD